MAEVTVIPDTFSFTMFQADDIRAAAAQVAEAIGIDRPLRLEVDDSTPGQRMTIAAVDPEVVLAIQGAALEHPQRPRQFGEAHATENLARVLYRVADRLDPAFGQPPAEDELGTPEKFAWETYAVGRSVRAGLGGREPHRRYLFRHRHGFTDTADAAFDRLWQAASISWAEIADLSESALAAASASTPTK